MISLLIQSRFSLLARLVDRIAAAVSGMWREERPRLFLWTPVVMGVGIGLYFSWPDEPNLAVAIGMALATGIILAVMRGHVAARAVFLVFLGFALAASASRVYGTPLLDWPTRASVIEGTIADVEQHKSGRRLLLENLTIEHLPDHRKPRRIRMVMPRRLDKQAPDIRPGQHLQALAKLMPLSEPMTPDGFDFRRNAFFQGIGATGYLLGRIRVTESGAQDASGYRVWFAQLRQNIQAVVKQAMTGDRAGLAIILLTGDKTFLSPETTAAMRGIGLAHLLAIAGLHIGLVAGAVFFLSRALMALFPALALRFPIKKWAAALALSSICFYTLLVGAPVPTRRALVMTGIVLIAVMLDRISVSLRTLALAAFVILLLWPQMLLHPAFQLSFAAVLGLISVGEWTRRRGWRLFPEREGWVWNVLRHIVELAGMSVVATLATLPFCLYHFQEAEVYSVLANTLAIPLTSFWLMPVCVFVILLWPFGLAAWPLKLLDPGVGILIGLSHKIAGLPGAHYSPPPMPVWLLLAATGGALVFCLMSGRRRWVGLPVMLIAIALDFFQPRPSAFLAPKGEQAGWWRRETAELLITSYDKPDKYLAGYWGERYGYKEDNIRYVQAEEDEPPLSCDASRCVWREGSQSVAWLADAEALPRECAAGHVLLVNFRNYEGCGGSSTAVLTKASFRQHGAHAIYSTGNGLEIRHAREDRARRPWSVGWRPKKKNGGFL
ncbi:MAG: ComEC/Rec2 family competence protein [Alphaproteobacteria bacterium]|nr:ComEC/Rec2 family competence protein [Alphaproteobacteria bacterium]